MGEKGSRQIYQLKLTLKRSKPPIWRRLLVPGDTPLPRLHDVFQIAMGWGDAHLHQFTVGRATFSEPHPEYGSWMPLYDERKFQLNQIAPGEKSKFIYEYDFGDSWEHVVLVEKVLTPEPGQRYPVCVKGRRACPPEDVGGIWGYDAFLEAMGDPTHPEHASYREWIGEDFHPEAFDLEQINRRLRGL